MNQSASPMAATAKVDPNWVDLVGQPWRWALVLLLARLVANPYLGLFHDAQLYAVQVMQNATGGDYGQDLFFLYGSQDQYSIFSTLVSPLVRAVGLSSAFLIVYLLCSYLFLVAQSSLLYRWLSDVRIAAASGLVLAVTDLTYGGWGIFRVHEPFLTARLPASALVLFALDQGLAHRSVRSLCLIALAIVFHPIMGACGLAVLIAGGLLRFRRGVPLAVGGALGSMVLLALGVRAGMIATMDADWLATVRAISPQCFPSEWKLSDGLDVGFAAAILLLGVTGPDRMRRLSTAVLAVGLTGVAVAAFAEIVPIPLLVQAQPMRALWPMMFLAIPVALFHADHYWNETRATSKLLALLLVFWGCRLRDLEHLGTAGFGPILAICIIVALMFARGLAQGRDRNEVLWRGALAGLLGAALLQALFIASICLTHFGELTQVVDPLLGLSATLRVESDILPLIVGAVVVLAVFWRAGSARAILVRTLVGVTLAITALGVYHSRLVPPDGGSDVTFIRRHLVREDGSLPTVYWPTDIRNLWFQLPAQSYYHFAQVQGAVFSRSTTAESQRRLDLVRPFEVRRARLLGEWAGWERLSRLLGAPGLPSIVTARDLDRLALDTELDAIALPFPVLGRPAPSNGHVWIYDARSLRAHASRSTTTEISLFQPASGEDEP